MVVDFLNWWQNAHGSKVLNYFDAVSITIRDFILDSRFIFHALAVLKEQGKEWDRLSF